MSLRCLMCNRQTSNPTAWLGGKPVGPVCAKRLGIQDKSRRIKDSEAERDDRTLDLFAVDRKIDDN